MKKLVVAGLSALIAGTLLTGCMKMEDSIIINSDGSCTLSGEISIEKDTLFKTYADITGGSSGPVKEAVVKSALEKQGFVPVTIDGKDYYKISTSKTSGAESNKCDNIADFYRYLSKNLAGMLHQNEDNVVSLSETSVVLRMPANLNIIQDMLKSTASADDTGNAGGTANAVLDMADNEKILESLKDAIITYNVTFPAKIEEVSSNVTLSEDGKTMSVSFPVITDKVYDEYAYCENDIAAEGALNGVTYNKTVTVSLPEGTTATLNGSPVTNNRIDCKKTGTYNFKLSDGRTTETLCFIVDKSAPVIARQKDSGKLEFSDFDNGQDTVLGKGYIAVYDPEGGIKEIKADGTNVLQSTFQNIDENKDKNSLVSSYFVYSLDIKNFKEGRHSIKASDNFGNVSTKKFIVDKTKPLIKGIKDGKTYNKAVTIKFSDKNGIKSAKLNGKTVKTGVKASKKGTYTLKVTDNAGNVQKVKFTIKK